MFDFGSRKIKSKSRKFKSKTGRYINPSFTAQELGITKKVKYKDFEKEFNKKRIGGLNYIPKFIRNG